MSPANTTPRHVTSIKFKSDPKKSTYRWECDMTQDSHNRVPLIEGYSKGQGFEHTNRVELLIRKIQNPLSLYLQKSDEIRIYENMKELPGGQLIQAPKERQPLLLTLNRRGYIPHGWVSEAEVVRTVLNELYLSIKAGVVPERSTGRRKNVWHKELDHSGYTFSTLGELTDFCKRLSHTYGLDCMRKWYVAHCDFQPELTKPAGVPLVAEGHSVEAMQVQQALQGLYNRHQ